MFSKAIIATTLLSVVSAHQNWVQLWINNETPGNQVGIRMPPNNSPVTDLTSNDMACNVGGSKVPSGVKTLEAKEGDSIKVQWTNSGHPGPITHFLFGPVADASQATGVGEWFKIDELDYTGGKWASEIMQAANMTHEFKLPTGLKSGEYLLRSEMLALHASQTLGGGQFYIGCAQLKIAGTGSGTCGPKIKLPGAYTANDKDIYIPNYYNGYDPKTFAAPGGPVASCGGSASGGGSGSGDASEPKPATPSPTTPSPAAPAKSSAAVSASPSPPAVPSAALSTVPSPVPSKDGGNGQSGALPASFTMKTFIAWLEGKAGAKARRHARAF